MNLEYFVKWEADIFFSNKMFSLTVVINGLMYDFWVTKFVFLTLKFRESFRLRVTVDPNIVT